MKLTFSCSPSRIIGSDFFRFYGAGLLTLCLFAAATPNSHAQPDPNWLDHDRDRPMAPVVQPAVASHGSEVGKAPSDAVILFDGKDISSWVALDGSPTQWKISDGALECVQGSGYVRTLQNFGDCQLHVEWATPTPPHGEGQGRGNSGVFFGLDRYEVQVLDSYKSKTYADGAAGAIYGQYPPTANACLAPGVWQTYDIVYEAPRFDADKKMISPVHLTVILNGVLVQNHVSLTGPTSWLERAPYRYHPEKQPISLQDHGNPVRYRNIWVRELGKPSKKEFNLPIATLDGYTGTYDRIKVKREDNQLVALLGSVKFVMFADSPTHFFAKTTDFQMEFPKAQTGKVESVTWSVGEGANVAEKSKH